MLKQIKWNYKNQFTRKALQNELCKSNIGIVKYNNKTRNYLLWTFIYGFDKYKTFFYLKKLTTVQTFKLNKILKYNQSTEMNEKR